MAKKRFTPEQIITMLREYEALLNQSNPSPRSAASSGYLSRPITAGMSDTAG